MIVPEKCYSIIEQSLTENGFIGKVSKENPKHLSRHYLDERRLREQLDILESFTPVEGMFLEVGSGYGGLVTYMNKMGAENLFAYGVEPSADSYEATLACTKILSTHNEITSKFVAAPGELLPFKSGTFDIVYSTSVLEHVKHPESVIREAVRVLKPGGIFQFVIPNYGSWWEGHYGTLMVPHMPKWAFKLYVRLKGRDPSYVDTLQFTTRKSLLRILSMLENKIEIVSWGEDVWEKRLRSLDFSDWASLGRLKIILKWVRRLGLIRLTIHFGRMLHWETPFILTLRKKNVLE